MQFYTDTPIVVQQLCQSVYRGAKITVRVRDAFATGYLVGMDDTDLLLAMTFDGTEELDPPILVVICRRMVSVVNCHPETTYSEESEDIRSFCDPFRDDLMDHINERFLAIEAEMMEPVSQ